MRSAYLLLILALLFSALGQAALAQDSTASNGIGFEPSGARPIPAANPEQLSLLHIATIPTGQSIQRALSELGFAYGLYQGTDWTGLDFTPYDVVLIGMDGGLVSQASVQAIRTGVIDQGKRVILVGGTNYADFAIGVDQHLVNIDAANHGWMIPDPPTLGLLNTDHPLGARLPTTHTFVDSAAAYYMLRETDPMIDEIAMNGDGVTALFYKDSSFPVVEGAAPEAGGSLVWFINSASDQYWANEADYRVLKQVLINALGYGWTPGPADPHSLYRYDCVWFDDGSGAMVYNRKVYCLGGRVSSASETADIWRYDPLTENWQDTGHDMVEDVSNYKALVLQDENYGGQGTAIYVVGGYDADNAGANVSMVQRYYPATGLTQVVNSDPWPVTVGGEVASPGSCEVAQNQIYCFGGWENAVAPYFGAETWTYDPEVPAGSRWQRVLSADLSEARGYIQSAVHHDVIYAMGGIALFDGGVDLVPTTRVEALDTNNLAAGWQVLASMPVASGEGRGFAWGGKLYVAGGGDWPDQSDEVMEYDVNTNVWNADFPDLITARRDHAGALIPLCTPDPTDGLPGMWVYGGRISTDEPPYGQPEYYSLPCHLTYLPTTLKN
jgi:hypothetical protein